MERPTPLDTPLISVVIAAYRADRYLELAVRDAVAQTYPAVEVLVSDDAASDATRAVAAAGGPRVTYRANPIRLGVAGNHWAAFRAARGDWMAILNHDDRWEPTFLARMMAAVADVPDTVLGFCDHHVIDAEGDRHPDADAMSARYGRDRLLPGRQPAFAPLVLGQTIPMAMGSVFRKAALGDLATFPADAGPAYDLWLTYLLARSGGAAVYVPDKLTSWRAHPANQTSVRGWDWLAGTARCWAAMAADPAFRGVRQEVRRRAAGGYVALGKACLLAGEPPAARAAAWASLRARPSVRGVVTLALGTLPSAVARRVLARARPPA